MQGTEKTFSDLRKQQYENIIDETLFIARASEGAVSADWIMSQPVFIRKKYVESFTEELKEREKMLKQRSRK